jgi:hypothetical protein
VQPHKLVLILASVALLWAPAASAQSQGPWTLTSSILKSVARDPATYAPGPLKYQAMRLDWDSSQIFFQHGSLSAIRATPSADSE